MFAGNCSVCKDNVQGLIDRQYCIKRRMEKFLKDGSRDKRKYVQVNKAIFLENANDSCKILE